jgi:hypothetical protein
MKPFPSTHERIALFGLRRYSRIFRRVGLSAFKRGDVSPRSSFDHRLNDHGLDHPTLTGRARAACSHDMADKRTQHIADILGWAAK